MLYNSVSLFSRQPCCRAPLKQYCDCYWLKIAAPCTTFTYHRQIAYSHSCAGCSHRRLVESFVFDHGQHPAHLDFSLSSSDSRQRGTACLQAVPLICILVLLVLLLQVALSPAPCALVRGTYNVWQGESNGAAFPTYTLPGPCLLVRQGRFIYR